MKCFRKNYFLCKSDKSYRIFKNLILQTQEVEYNSKFVQEKKITKTYAADQANTSFG